MALEWSTEQKVPPARLPQWHAMLRTLEALHGWAAVEGLVAWVRADEFWSRSCRSPLKLAKRDKDGITYWDRIASDMNRPARFGPAPKHFDDIPDLLGPETR
jgi:hypothetical protein